MLVLSRKKDERIVIDGRISVTILGINAKTVRLGVEAPREIPVHREELERALRPDRPNAA
jgi:carbon storage regulator